MHLTYLEGTNPSAQKLQHEAGILYYIGRANMKWSDVCLYLAGGKFPEHIRGNFAFIWQAEKETIAATDHLSSTPLFYTQNKISSLFYDLSQTLAIHSPNEKVKAEIAFLGGQSFINEETTIKEIKRVLPGHVLRNGKQSPYIDFYQYCEEKKLQKDQFIPLVEAAVAQGCKENNLLLLSGGTDSTAIAGIIKKLRLEHKFKFIHIYSDHQMQTDLPIVEVLQKEMHLTVDKVKIDFSGNIDPTISGRQFSFWVENPFPAKRTAAIECGGLTKRIFTGEIGDQLFGGPKNGPLMNYVLQKKPCPYEIADLWINLSASYGRDFSLHPSLRVQNLFHLNSQAQECHGELREKIANTFSKMKSQDYLNRILLLNYLVKGPYRTWSYSQDQLDWYHPFASWELFDYCFRVSSFEKIQYGGMSKAILLQCWQDNLCELPWRVAKNGFGIPARSKIRSLSRNLEYR